jgi:hypothetical protein
VGSEYDGFLSYRRADVSVARALHALLGAFNHKVFLDVACIPAGTSWEAAITEAACHCRWLVVLWSRNAASSGYMKREWGLVPPDCHILPVRLDESALPDELAHLQAVEGLGAAKLILARSTELMAGGKMSAGQARAVIVEELRKDGAELTPEQDRALGVFLARYGKTVLAGGAALAAWLFSRGAHAAVSVGGATVVGTVVAAFGAGYLIHDTNGPPAPPVVVHEEPSHTETATVQHCTAEPGSAGYCAELNACEKTVADQTGKLSTCERSSNNRGTTSMVGEKTKPAATSSGSAAADKPPTANPTATTTAKPTVSSANLAAAADHPATTAVKPLASSLTAVSPAPADSPH